MALSFCITGFFTADAELSKVPGETGTRNSCYALQNDTASHGTSSATGDFYPTIMADGTSRIYRLYVPPNYNPSTPMPMLIYIHGYTTIGTLGGENEEWQIWQQMGYTSNFIIVAPRGDEDFGAGKISWKEVYEFGSYPMHDSLLMMAIYDATVSTYNIDLSKVWMMGISDGGKMSLRSSLLMSDKISCDCPCEASYKDVFADPALAVRKYPFYELLGDQDYMLPGAQQSQSVFTAAGFPFTLEVIPGRGHGYWEPSWSTKVYNFEKDKILQHNWIRPHLSFITPASGDRVPLGSHQNIDYYVGCGNPPYNITFQFSGDGALGPWTNITQFQQDNYGEDIYDWAVSMSLPETPDGCLRAIVTDSSTPAKTNISTMDYTFEISPVAPAPEGSALVLVGTISLACSVAVVSRKKWD